MTPTDFLPEWRDAPPCPGVYVTRNAQHSHGSAGAINLRTRAEVAAWGRKADLRWYGPLPADPKAAEGPK